MTDTADIRRGAITEIYRKSNRELAQEVDTLKKRLAEAEGLLIKSTAVIEDVRMIDRYNSRVDFDVEELLKDLQKFHFTTPTSQK